MSSCVYIPNEKGKNTESNLFKDLLSITNNREATKHLWALSQDSALLSALNLNPTKEPSAVELLSAFENITDTLDPSASIRYANFREDLKNKSFDTFGEVLNNSNIISSRYPNSVPNIYIENNKYKIELVENTEDNAREYARLKALGNLNSKMLNYMNKLGFKTEEVYNLESPGVFSPITAENNADELKTIIQLSKGIEGQKALSEEFSHFILEGYINHPLFKRLLSVINDDIVKEVLGNQYDQYKEIYSGNDILLKKEAAAKIIGQYIANREGLNNEISYISNRALNIIQSVFSNGNVETVDGYLSNLNSDIETFLSEILDNNNVIPLFSSESVLSASKMYNLKAKTESFLDIAKSAEETLAKRAKLLSLKNKEGKLDKDSFAAYEKTKRSIEAAKHVKGCIHFIEYVHRDCNRIHDRLLDLQKTIKGKSMSNTDLRRACNILLDIESIQKGYSPIVATLQNLKHREDLISDVNVKDIDTIVDLATDADSLLKDLQRLHKELRLNTLLNFYSSYWKEDFEVVREGKKVKFTLEDALNSSIGDINGFTRLVNSMQDMSDPFLQLVHIAYQHVAGIRDKNLADLQQKIAIIQRKYTEKTGSRDTSFMYAKNAKGELTGMLVSDIDFEKFYADRNAYLESLKASGTDPKKINLYLKQWTQENTELVEWSSYNKERLPMKSKYAATVPLSSRLTEAQLEYYNDMMAIKKELSSLIPNKNTHLYRAVQKKAPAFENALRGNLKNVAKNIRDQYISSVDDTEYGEEVLDKGKWVIRDFAGNPVRKVPVYYTTFLDDMKMLDTNFSETLMAFGSTAFNYHHMNKLADIMELTNSLAIDRKIIQTEGGKNLYERFVLKNDAFQKEYEKLGIDSNVTKKLRNFIDANIYGKRKDSNKATVGNTKIQLDKVGDTLLSYGSLVNIGINAISSATNVVTGNVQNMIEAFGGEHYSFKTYLKASAMIIKNLPSIIKDTFADAKNSKIMLFLEKMDALEDFHDSLTNTGLNKGIIKKVISKLNPFILQTMGEFQLRSVPALAMALDKKVKYNGKEMNLYDVLQITDNVYTDSSGKEYTYKSLELPEGITELDGTTFDEDAFYMFKQTSQYITHGSQGAYGMVDRGDISKHIGGRALMQYRQWMPAMYTRRYGKARNSVLLKGKEERTYATAWNFLLNSLKDLFQLKFNIATNWAALSNHQKANCRKALAETGLYYLIGICLNALASGMDDKEDPGILNPLKLVLYRFRMELGGVAPTTGAIDSWKMLTLSPIPAVESSDRLIMLLNFPAMFRTIEHGKYAGWNEYLKYMYYGLPYVRNIDRLTTVYEGDLSSFNLYMK